MKCSKMFKVLSAVFIINIIIFNYDILNRNVAAALQSGEADGRKVIFSSDICPALCCLSRRRAARLGGAQPQWLCVSPRTRTRLRPSTLSPPVCTAETRRRALPAT